MKNKNFKIFICSNALAYFVIQFIGPFLVIFLNQKGGGIENLGLLYGASLFAYSITAFFVGKYSDKVGRKPFIIISAFATSIILVAYIYVQNLFQLYAVQIFYGIVGAMWVTMESVFLADITTKKTRGKMMGTYNLILGVIMAIGLMLGGFVVGRFGFNIVFWFVSIVNLISAFILLFIEETNPAKKKSVESKLVGRFKK